MNLEYTKIRDRHKTINVDFHILTVAGEFKIASYYIIFILE